MHPQANLFNMQGTPYLQHQVFIADDLAGISDETKQDIECTAAEADRTTVDAELPLTSRQAKGTEFPDMSARHRSLLWSDGQDKNAGRHDLLKRRS
jgi:hypothetical protein